MAETNFVDYVKIYCRSGKGGAGSTHLHREKFTPKGGPDGGEVQAVVSEPMERTKSSKCLAVQSFTMRRPENSSAT